jgi:hypothetical protein
MTTHDAYPALPLSEWRESKTTLHLFSQIIGKVRLNLAPKQNHWWHVPLYVSGRGLTTSAIPYKTMVFELVLDLVDHQLVLTTSRGDKATVPLENTTVSDFYAAVMKELAAVGIDPGIHPVPFDPSKVGSDIPFSQDTQHKAYERFYVDRYWQILSCIEPIFVEFRGRYLGKCSPVHLFWHSLDLAVTRFSGRSVALPENADPVTMEAYSHEVSSAGFWVGDDSLQEPAFYSYAHTEPKGLADQPLRPDSAMWNSDSGSAMAILRYEDFRHAADPRQTLLDFLQSSYEAAANLGNWPRSELEVTSV